MQAINANPVLLDYDTCRDQSKQLGVETWFQVMFMWMGKDDGTLRPRIYGITAANLTTYMLLHPGDERLAIIDTRTIDEAGPAPMQLNRAYHIAVSDRGVGAYGARTTASMAVFRQKKDATLQELMAKEFLVFHCREGLNRTPAMAHSYLAAMNDNQYSDKVNPNQKVCLLFGGFAGGSALFARNQLLEPFRPGPAKDLTAQPTKVGETKPAGLNTAQTPPQFGAIKKFPGKTLQEIEGEILNGSAEFVMYHN